MKLKILPNNGPIVLVDDDKMEFLITELKYKKTNLKNPLLYFSTGDEFLDYMEKVISGKEVKPAVVLLDINMPKMDGFEVLSHIKKQGEAKECPVILMFSSSPNPVDKEKAEQNGADGYIEKPSDPSGYEAIFNSLDL